MRKSLNWQSKKIIAVDFDGTLTEKDNRIWIKRKSFNDIKIPNVELIKWLKYHRNNYYLILWTLRTGKDLKSAVEWCNSHGLYFDAVNENIFPFKTSRKIYADYYIDDHNITIDEIDKING